MHTYKLGRTYRYVVCEMENRYGDVGPGQVRGRREIGWLREQQDNIAGGIWYGKGEKRRGQYVSGLFGDAFRRLTDAVHYHRGEQVQRNL
jgi:hypothetical protein